MSLKRLQGPYIPNWTADKYAFIRQISRIGADVSILEETWECSEHGPFTIHYSEGNFKGVVYCHKCKETAEIIEASRDAIAQSLLPYSGLDRKQYSLSVDAWACRIPQDRTAKEKVRAFLQNPQMSFLLMLGKTGSGKTHMACGIVADSCRSGRSALIITMRALDYRIQGTWRGSKTTEALLSELTSLELLILDEVVRPEKEHLNSFLDELFKRRDNLKRKTILISNYPEQQLAGFFDDTIRSRMLNGRTSAKATFVDNDRRFSPIEEACY